MIENRRSEYRFEADFFVHSLKLPNAQLVRARGILRDLSAAGCRLESEVELEAGQELVISFDLTPDERLGLVRARVVRLISPSPAKLVALEFLCLSDHDQYRIHEYIVWQEAQEVEK